MERGKSREQIPPHIEAILQLIPAHDPMKGVFLNMAYVIIHNPGETETFLGQIRRYIQNPQDLEILMNFLGMRVNGDGGYHPAPREDFTSIEKRIRKLNIE
ncbi:MAG: hypothetical protein V1679_01745 [Candidatus Peregrinibacteria bacterium]